MMLPESKSKLDSTVIETIEKRPRGKGSTEEQITQPPTTLVFIL